jgi:hypothetical protein
MLHHKGHTVKRPIESGIGAFLKKANLVPFFGTFVVNYYLPDGLQLR